MDVVGAEPPRTLIPPRRLAVRDLIVHSRHLLCEILSLLDFCCTLAAPCQSQYHRLILLFSRQQLRSVAAHDVLLHQATYPQRCGSASFLYIQLSAAGLRRADSVSGSAPPPTLPCTLTPRTAGASVWRSSDESAPLHAQIQRMDTVEEEVPLSKPLC